MPGAPRSRSQTSGDVLTGMSIACVCITASSVFSSGKIVNSTRSSFGRPLKYRSLRARTMRVPRSHRTNRNGPLPTGAALNGASLIDASPASRCAGTIGFAPSCNAVKNSLTNGGYLRRRCTTTVPRSGVSIERTSSYPSRCSTLLRGFMIACHENATSRDVNGKPSCQRTPLRRWYVYVRPSGETPPLASDGTVVARSPAAEPSRRAITKYENTSEERS